MKSNKPVMLLLSLLVGVLVFALVTSSVALVAWIGGAEMFTADAGFAAFMGVFSGGSAAVISAICSYKGLTEN